MNLLIAFFAGLATFFSPCVFPLVPSYISYVTGFSIEELSMRDRKLLLYRSIMGSLCFVSGFSMIFVALGFSASFVGSLFFELQNYLRMIGGLIIIFFGLILTGVLRIGFFEIEKRFRIKKSSFTYAGAFILGMTFSAGWVPCAGPILSSILAIAATSGSRFYGGLLLFSYCLGLGLPIVASAVVFNYFLVVYRNTVKYLRVISIISGIILIMVGLLLMTDSLTSISNYITYIFGAKGIQ